MTDAATITTTTFNITFVAEAPLPVGVDVEVPVLVLLTVDVDSDALVEDAADVPVEELEEGVAEAAETVEVVDAAEFAVPVEVALVDRVVEVVRLIPQTAKASNVNGIFQA
jgi:hypothetical protein